MPATRPRHPRRLLHRLLCAPPEPVAEGVELLRGGLTRTMNVVLIDDPAGPGVVVFDAGEQGMAPAILAAGRARGGIRRVVLGHGDTDHRGAAPAIAEAGGAAEFGPGGADGRTAGTDGGTGGPDGGTGGPDGGTGAPGPGGGAGAISIECHPDAVAQAEGSGGRDYWRPEQLPPAVRRFHGVMHHVWDGGPVRITRTVRSGDEVAGFRVVELPGHAPGLIGLWREQDRLALVSDAFYMTDMWGRSQDPALPLPAYNQDTGRARESLRALAALDPLTVVPGHLGPLRGTDLRARLEAAAGAPVD